VTTTQDEALTTAIPDLTDTSLDKLAEGGTVLADAVRRYRERLKENGVPLSSFNARI
jgi:hypothetical protein